MANICLTPESQRSLRMLKIQMIGGVVMSTVMELLVYPPIFYLWRSRKLSENES